MRPGESETPVICVVGRSKVGKTSFLEKLIPELKGRGYRVATVKRHAHPGFDIDYPGKDTWRHAQAGSDHVIIAAPDKVASIRRVSQEPALDELLDAIDDVDIILTEGYKRSSKPKIEILRAARHRQPLCAPAELFALVSDFSSPFNVPRFNLGDAAGVADLIEAKFLSKE